MSDNSGPLISFVCALIDNKISSKQAKCSGFMSAMSGFIKNLVTVPVHLIHGIAVRAPLSPQQDCLVALVSSYADNINMSNNHYPLNKYYQHLLMSYSEDSAIYPLNN